MHALPVMDIVLTDGITWEDFGGEDAVATTTSTGLAYDTYGVDPDTYTCYTIEGIEMSDEDFAFAVQSYMCTTHYSTNHTLSFKCGPCQFECAMDAVYELEQFAY